MMLRAVSIITGVGLCAMMLAEERKLRFRPAEAAPAAAATAGPLRVHPDNPRYFADSGGRPVYLAGSHAWYYIQGPDAGREKAIAFLDLIKARGHNFTRVWSFFPYLQITYDDVVNLPPLPWPYPRTGPGTALDGGPKFDLQKPVDAYLESLRDFVREAGKRGIYCSIMLFGSYNLIRDEEFPNSVWHRDNNVNPETAPLLTGPDFFKLDPGVLALQEQTVRHVVDALNEFDNVMWELMNEAMDAPGAAAWHDHMIRYIRSYEATKPRQHLVGMTGGPDRAGGQQMFESAADFVSPDNGSAGNYRRGGPGGHAQKPVISDVDHLWGVSYQEPGMRRWVWMTFTRGNHPIFMEDRRVLTQAPHPADDRIRYALGHTVAYARRMDLARVVPRGDLSSTGYALADPGREYLVYHPADEAVTVMPRRFTVDLRENVYRYEWFNPATGTVAATGTIRAAGGMRKFAAPFPGDAVLYLKAVGP